MQTFRAYLQDDVGAITWASWIDADHLDEAKRKARDLCGDATPTVDLWFVTDRRSSDVWELDPV
jgi:4-alpha-glucanotransferase